MTPERAHAFGVSAADVRITSTRDKHAGCWVVWVLAGGRRQVLTQFSPDNLFGACRWRARLARMEG